MREIHIRPVLNGFIVTVGCQELVCVSMEFLTKELTRYYDNPEAVEKEYRDRAVNKDLKKYEEPRVRNAYDQAAKAQCEEPLGILRR